MVAAIIRGAGQRVLLARRSAGGPHGGLWEFPGGKVEDGESPEAALEREIREELGVEVAVGEAVMEVEHHYPHLSIRLLAYECRVRRGTPRPLECAAVAWVEPRMLQTYPMPEADRPIARRLSNREGP